MLDPKVGTAYCFPTSGGEIDKPIIEMPGYTCFSPDDYQILTEWIKRHKNGAK